MKLQFSHQHYLLIKDFFKNDEAKTIAWFNCPNPGLGGITPLHMIKVGRSAKLIKFIESSLEGNYR